MHYVLPTDITHDRLSLTSHKDAWSQTDGLMEEFQTAAEPVVHHVISNDNYSSETNAFFRFCGQIIVSMVKLLFFKLWLINSSSLCCGIAIGVAAGAPGHARLKFKNCDMTMHYLFKKSQNLSGHTPFLSLEL